LYVLSQHDQGTYQQIAKKEKLTLEIARRFLVFFAEKCCTSSGLTVWKSDQMFSRDQLLPLLYLLSCVNKYDNDADVKAAGKKIVNQLSGFEEIGHGLSTSNKVPGPGQSIIGPNISYLIQQLCEQYGVVYRYRLRPAWIAAAVPEAAANAAANIVIGAENTRRKLMGKELLPLLETDTTKLADSKYEEALEACFEHALAWDATTAQYEESTKEYWFSVPRWVSKEGKVSFELSDVVAGYSVFNSLASLSMLLVQRGRVDGRLGIWRGILSAEANLGWGPGFEIVCGRNVRAGVSDSPSWRTSSQDDNDIVQSQRPLDFITGNFPAKSDSGHRTLDFIILAALSAIWD